MNEQPDKQAEESEEDDKAEESKTRHPSNQGRGKTFARRGAEKRG